MGHAPDADTIRGIMPVLFHIGNLPVSTYTVFVLLGIAAGALVYFYEAKKHIRTTNFHS
jgi:prolipoprotein diacylglyceryltransferase